VSDEVHIAAFWDEDTEAFWFSECWPGDYDDDSRVFEGDVPAEVWGRKIAAWCDMDLIAAQLSDLLGVEGGRRKEPCAAWNGEEAGPDIPEWWIVALSASDGTEWPINDTTIGFHQPTEEAATEYIASLPDEFYLMAPGPRPVRVTKDRLAIEHHGPISQHDGTCQTCGWERHEHAAGSAAKDTQP
jgi:hypothetical protein